MLVSLRRLVEPLGRRITAISERSEKRKTLDSIVFDLRFVLRFYLRMRIIDDLCLWSIHRFRSFADDFQRRISTIFTWAKTLARRSHRPPVLARLATLGRVYGFYSLFLSITFVIFGYLIGGIIVDLDEQFNIRIEYLRKEYLYSVLYGAIFYTTLVTLVRAANSFIGILTHSSHST